MRKFFFTFILATFFVAASAHAQFSAVPDPVQYIVAPETPGPDAPVYIEAQGVGSFLGNSTITWTENGSVASTGVGDANFQLTTGPVGTATTVHVEIDSSQGTFTHDWVFAPSVVDLVWEADTSVPLFYVGKPLYSSGSTLKVVAFPTIVSGTSLVPASQLSFQWSLDGSLVPASSGLGKNTYIFQGDEVHNSEDVSVDIYFNGNDVGSGDIVIPATTPQIVFYDADPLRGELLDFALPSSFNLNASEVTLQAEPYYFANSSLNSGALSYAWTLNGNDTAGPDSPKGVLTLRQTGTGAGSASVGVSIQNTESDKFTQAAQSALNIVFGQSGGSSFTSLFGL